MIDDFMPRRQREPVKPPIPAAKPTDDDTSFVDESKPVLPAPIAFEPPEEEFTASVPAPDQTEKPVPPAFQSSPPNKKRGFSWHWPPSKRQLMIGVPVMALLLISGGA